MKRRLGREEEERGRKRGGRLVGGRGERQSQAGTGGGGGGEGKDLHVRTHTLLK